MRRPGVLALSVSLSLLGLVPRLSATDVPAGWVSIVSENSGKCLDVPWWKPTNYARNPGTVLQQWTCWGGDMQQFQLTPVQGGYKITSKISGQVLDIRGGPSATRNGVPVQQWPYLGGSNQIFRLVRQKDGTYLITAVNSGKRLDVVAISKNDGAALQQWADTGGANQKWRLVPVAAPAPAPSADSAPASSPAPGAPSNLTGLWANEGGDKVTQDELRVSKKSENLTGTVRNNAWDGTTIKLSGARNETVSFNLVLEAAQARAPQVAVFFNTLTGPNGAKIQTVKQATGNDIFSYVGRPIELFYMRYLPIRGMSFFGWYLGNEQGFPPRMRATSGQNWTSRPDHDKNYPDILVPLELVPTFEIAAGQNQSVWADIYIPKGTPAGAYRGTLAVTENGAVTHSVPVSLTVQPFALPDAPAIKQFTNLDPTELMWRYFTGAGGYVGWGTDQGKQVKTLADTYYQFFHRHGIDLIAGETECPSAGTQPCAMNLPRYTGDLYTAAHGYEGRGAGVGTSLYSIGTYGTWNRAGTTTAAQSQALADAWESWFEKNLPNTTRFIYLQDEPTSSDWPKVENWAKWMGQSAGPGKDLLTLSTVSRSTALLHIPDLKIALENSWIGDCGALGYGCDVQAVTTNELAQYQDLPNRHVWEYNLNSPGVGTANTEDNGVAMRTVAWVQYKMNVERWFYWFANLNSQDIDLFAQACTWNCTSNMDPAFGLFSQNGSTNGNGLLVYPGTDVSHKNNSYGVQGPFASLRLKEWRRGIEDGDYLTIAAQLDPTTTQAIVQKVMPKALWENPAPDHDPSWFRGPVSWSANPDDWEAARTQLAAIISKACVTNSNASYCQ
jgi:hypothetical protein